MQPHSDGTAHSNNDITTENQMVYDHIFYESVNHAYSHFTTIPLTHRGRVTHICLSKLTIIGSDNGLSPARRQAIIWTNDGILLIRTFRTHFSEIISEIHTFYIQENAFESVVCEMASDLSRPQCLNTLCDPSGDEKSRHTTWHVVHQSPHPSWSNCSPRLERGHATITVTS